MSPKPSTVFVSRNGEPVRSIITAEQESMTVAEFVASKCGRCGEPGAVATINNEPVCQPCLDAAQKRPVTP